MLTKTAAAKLLKKLDPNWSNQAGMKIARTFTFRDFREAMRFVYRIAHIAENEGHHPDIRLTYNIVTIELFTHAAKGLTENDFIVAAKIDEVFLANAA